VTEPDWVEDALAAQVLPQATAEEAATTIWAAVQPRLHSIDESLNALASDASDAARASAAHRLREHPRRLTGAVGTNVCQGPSPSPDTFRVNRAAAHAARDDLGETVRPAGQPAPDLTDSQ
jgi:hypothetical protein